MTDFDRLRGIAEREVARYLRDFSIFDLEVIYRHGLTAAERVAVLSMIRTDARIPAPPRIIRTREELADLDPDTVMQPPQNEQGEWPRAISAESLQWAMRTWNCTLLPAVVIATGEQILAARQVLKEET